MDKGLPDMARHVNLSGRITAHQMVFALHSRIFTKRKPNEPFIDMSDANSFSPNPVRGIFYNTFNLPSAIIYLAPSLPRAAFWALLSLFFAPVLLHAQATNLRLSGAAKVSIFTIAPGDEVYSVFGHSAIRVQDPAYNLDRIYNYGTFDFDETFVWKFTRGKLNYRLSVEDYERFDYKYRYFNRSFTEQVLNFSPEQAQAVFNFLEKNYLPENRYYLYDFFYDNCATKIPDVFNAALGGQLIYAEDAPEQPLSFRDMIDIYCENSPWLDLGIDLALGLPTDKIMSWDEYMFLPDYVFKEFGEAQIRTPNGALAPLVTAERPIFTAAPSPSSSPFPQPFIVFWGIFLVVGIFTVIGYRRKARLKIVDVLLFGMAGLTGCMIIFLWFFTDHTATTGNLNILWAWPTHLVVGLWLLTSKNLPKFLIYYFFATALMALLLIIGWQFLPQNLHTAMFPMVLAIGMRALYIYTLEMGKKKSTAKTDLI